MKKLLLLLFTLFTSLSGAWAVSPNASAYPKIGRTYYLTVSKDATKRYIYNDGGTLKSTTTAPSAGDTKYLWFVQYYGGYYRISNVDTKKGLGWKAMGSQTDIRYMTEFVLGNDVIDGSCVSLCNSSTGSDLRWMVTKMTADNTFDQYTVAINDGTWCSDYLFEEYIPSSLVTDGTVYYVYCKNKNASDIDVQQYLYNNDSSLGVATSNSESSSRYMWIAELTDDGYYTFRNVNGQKYLGWKGVTNDAYKWSLNTLYAINDGYAPMISSDQSAFMLVKKDNSLNNAYVQYNRANTDFSNDYGFTAVSTSSYDIYSVIVNSPSSITPYITYSGEGYVNPNIYNGGKLVVATGTSVSASDFTAYDAGENYNVSAVSVNSSTKTITITYTGKWEDMITSYLSENHVSTMLGKTGVGYPKSTATARTDLQTIYNTVTDPAYDYATNGETDYPTLTAAFDAYLACEDINYPVEGKSYTFRNFQKSTDKIYTLYHYGGGEFALAEYEGATYYGDFFVAHKLPGTNEYFFVARDASNGDVTNYHAVIAASNGKHMTNGFNATYSPIRVKKLPSTSSNYEGSPTSADLFGGFYLEGTRTDGTTNGNIIVTKDGNFQKASTAPYWKNDYTSAFYIVEGAHATETYYNTVNLRQAGDDSYATTYLPFAVELPDNIKAYKASVSGDVLTLSKVADGTDVENNVLPAKTAAILWSEGATVKGNTTLSIVSSDLSAPNDNVLHGTLADNTTVSATTYVLSGNSSGAGFYPLDGTTAPICKAYYDALGVGVKSFSFNFEDDVDGISHIEDGKLNIENAKIYNLAGQRVSKPTRGLYIVNGKKLMIK
ncbi:MAG: hypothetical protein J5671_05235 [Bacteroidaceae bacterium]|nr:hypothetical protein [Bacteroidaceae bacterium]